MDIVESIDEVLGLLQAASDGNIPSVRRELKQGDLVSTYSRITDDYWFIDDPNIYKGLFNNDELPLVAIYELLSGPSERRRRLFETEGEVVQGEGDIPFDYRFLPFSRAVETRIGVCVEKSILLQLSQQEKSVIFLTRGSCEIGDEHGGHAFNIMLQGGKLMLVDVKRRESGNGYDPYIVPIEGIDLVSQSVMLPRNLSEGRKYSITHLNKVFC